jgi:hypothetical protein
MLRNRFYPTSGGNGSRYQQINFNHRMFESQWGIEAAGPSTYIIDSTDLWARKIQLGTSERPVKTA